MKAVAGCDVGSLTTKAVIMQKGKIIGSHLLKSRVKPQDSAKQVMDRALEAAGLKMDNIACCVGTGYGRDHIPFINETRSEIACHARGSRWLAAKVRTIIDIGGQDCKVLRLDESGEVEKFVTNDKCASGTGRFLEVMANVLDISIEELGELTSRSRQPITLASTCTVWAQADVIKHINSGVPVEDIGAGVNLSMAKRVATLANSVKPEMEICMTGGVAKNRGVVSTLEKLMGCRFQKLRKGDPQLAGAIGAALIGEQLIREKL